MMTDTLQSRQNEVMIESGTMSLGSSEEVGLSETIEPLELRGHVISIDSDLPLEDAFDSTDSDIQAYAVLMFTDLVETRSQLPDDPIVKKFFDRSIIEGSELLRFVAVSRLIEGQHSWLLPYLIRQFRACAHASRYAVERSLELVFILCKYDSASAYHLVPHLIGLLREESSAGQRPALEALARFESSGVERLAEFVRSSYDWHIRSIYLRRERWTSVFRTLGTVMYGIVIALIAFISVPSLGHGYLELSLDIFFLILVLFVLAFSVLHVTDAEKELERSLSVGSSFLTRRKELRKLVQGQFARLLERKHQKWRDILGTVVRLYLATTIPLTIVAILGVLPAGTAEWGLIGLTLLFLGLSFGLYKKMRQIETELIEKQKGLLEYYISGERAIIA